jgi:hypothetical protein
VKMRNTCVASQFYHYLFSWDLTESHTLCITTLEINITIPSQQVVISVVK